MMLFRRFHFQAGLVLFLAESLSIPGLRAASVWKITNSAGGTLYLGGSIHALHSADYPLPAAYNRAFDASTRMAFEVDMKTLSEAGKGLVRAGQYPPGDSLKKHVDPRTYDYLRRFFGILRVPEEKISKFRPWFICLMLQAPALHGLSSELGVEEFLARRARTNGKPISGLETTRESEQIFSGLSDRESEAMLLLLFIPGEHGNQGMKQLIDAWRRGDVDSIARDVRAGYRDFPSLGERMIGARNRNWIPKIEGFLRSGQTYFVVVGDAHLGGPEGVLALLRARGYKIEQL